MKQDAVDASDSTSAPFALVVVDAVHGDAQLFQMPFHFLLLFRQIPRVRLHQVNGIELEGGVGPGHLHRQQPLTAQHLVQGAALGGLLAQDSPDQALALRRHPGGDAVGALQDAAAQLVDGVGPEGHGPRHHEEEEDPHGPDVHRRPHIVIIAEELGGSVGGRATEGVQDVAPVLDPGAEAKVGHFDTGITGEEHILSLQISMDDIIVMLEAQKEVLIQH